MEHPPKDGDLSLRPCTTPGCQTRAEYLCFLFQLECSGMFQNALVDAVGASLESQLMI